MHGRRDGRVDRESSRSSIDIKIATYVYARVDWPDLGSGSGRAGSGSRSFENAWIMRAIDVSTVRARAR
jgi:hypothetical protein